MRNQDVRAVTLHNATAELFVPDGLDVPSALARTTHMGVAAHQDDIEAHTYDGILKCFGRNDRFFCGVTVTNGAGTPRDGIYAHLTEAEIVAVRRKEQKKAAVVGEYGALAMLDYASAVVKDAADRRPVVDLKALFAAARPEAVYTHSPLDRHDTHVAVGLRVIEALRELPADIRPKQFYGVEGWRDFDWMIDEDRVCFDVSGHDNLANALIEVFDSQHCGVKRYDQALAARRRTHAVFTRSRSREDQENQADGDRWTYVIHGIDMTPLLLDPSRSVADYAMAYVERFRGDVAGRIDRVSALSDKSSITS